MSLRFSAALMAGASAIVATPSYAAVIFLPGPGALVTSYVNNFESVINSGPVTFTAGSLFLNSNANGGGSGPSGVQGLLVGTNTPITANLSGLYKEVGLYFGNDDLCCASNFNAVLSVYNGANFLGSVSLAANMNDRADQFIGLYSTEAFNRVVFDYSAPGLSRYIDDFRLGSAIPTTPSVPEPATWAMMLLGFGLVGGAMRAAKRRQRVEVRYA